MNRLTDVVKKLIILNVAVYVVATMLLPAFIPSLAMQTPFLFGLDGSMSMNPNFKPYTMVTHMFMHSKSGINHILFNMIALFFFGPFVERALGEKRFVILYFVSGFVAMFTHFLIDYITQGFSGVVGASGAIAGVLFAFIMMFPDVKVTLLIPPIPMKAKYLALIYIGIDVFRGFSASSNVAVFAHLGGAIAGVLLILYWKKSNFKL